MTEDYISYQTLSTKLKLISSIGAQFKLNTSTLEVNYDNTTTKVLRTIQSISGNKGTSRNDLYNFINQIVDESFRFILKYKNDNNHVNQELCKTLKESLVAVKINMTTNIRETYSHDQTFVIKLTELANQIDLRVRTLDNKDIGESLLGT